VNDLPVEDLALRQQIDRHIDGVVANDELGVDLYPVFQLLLVGDQA
jgi:hypothetical protein